MHKIVQAIHMATKSTNLRGFAGIYNTTLRTSCYHNKGGVQWLTNPRIFRHYSQSTETPKKAPKQEDKKENNQPPEEIDLNARKRKLIIVGVLGFSAYLAALFVYEKGELEKKYQQMRKAVSIKVEPLPYVEQLPTDVKIAKSIVNPKDQTGIKLTLYQFQTCPFCCKVRAFLDYYGFSYDVVEVNSITRKDVKWSEYKKVPFLTLEVASQDKKDKPTYIQLKDSSAIISLLSSCLRNPKEPLENLLLAFPSYRDPQNSNRLQFDNKYFVMYTEKGGLAKKQKYLKKERRLRQWVDDKFIHTISPNVYRTPSESLKAFNWYDEVGDWERLFSSWERFLVIYLGATVMWIIGKRLKSKYNINSDPRITLYDQADLWVREVESAGGKFIGGEHPNLADLSMYGVVSSFEGCEAFEDMRSHTNIGEWYERMRTTVVERQGGYKLAKRGAVNL